MIGGVAAFEAGNVYSSRETLWIDGEGSNKLSNRDIRTHRQPDDLEVVEVRVED